MKEAGKGSLLLPLGIGAGVLLLLTSMKKKQAEPAKTTEDTTAMPLVTADEAAAPQIDPAPAPQYTQAMPKSAPIQSEADGEDDGSQEDQEDGQQSTGSEDEEPETDDDSEEGSYPAASSRSSSGSRSNGGSNTPYQPSSTINANRPSQPLPATQRASATTRPAVNPKSIRFQSDQAKKFAARQKVRNANPLFIGNGKPRMGTQQSVAYRPGATAAVQQPIIIASQSTQPAPFTVKQTTIFPLRFGTTSPYVKEVQRRLGVSATGYFGTQTKAAIQKRFGVADISEALYKQIITGKAVIKTQVKRAVPHAVKRIKKPLPKKAKVIRRK